MSFMIHSDVIIVGGGPAGSTCAWRLRRQGVECIVLDKQAFPRPKLCAGWITPEALGDLQIAAAEYPHSLTRFRQLRVYLGPENFTVNAHQYAIRRIEFDDWLLQRAGVPVHVHNVKQIRRDGVRYVLDDRYSCDYLVGAGARIAPSIASCSSPAIHGRKSGRLSRLSRSFRMRCGMPIATCGFFRTDCRDTPGTCPKATCMSMWGSAVLWTS